MVDRVAAQALRLVNMRQNEWRLALALMLVLAINSVVLELADVIATAGFVNALGAAQVPWLWIVDMAVAVVVTGYFAQVVDRAPKLRVIRILIGLLATVYLGALVVFRAGLPDWITYPALYIVADQQFIILPLAFWALVNEVYSAAQAKRLIPLIAVGTALGSVIGNSLPALSAIFIGAQNAPGSGEASHLFVLAIALLLASLGILHLAFRSRGIHARSAGHRDAGLAATIAVGMDYFTNLALFRRLGTVMLLVGLALTILEFNLLYVLERSFVTNLAFQAFYGMYKVALIVSLMLFQGLITGRILQQAPLRNGYPALPSALVLASIIALVAPGLAGAAGGRFLARFVERAWDEPLRKATLALVPDERRGRISAFLDSYFFIAATLAGSVILLVLFRTGQPAWARASALAVALAASLGALWFGLRARAVYDASLLNWRLSRPRRKSVLDGIDF